MCYLCSCFSWILDLFQRLVTFFLACILCVVVCVGLVVAVAAGVAYGYNYSMSEYLTFKQQDVAVFMRRGEFHDSPDMEFQINPFDQRRSGHRNVDIVGSNPNIATVTDLEEASESPEPEQDLMANWRHAEDAKKYIEKLTKFTEPSTTSRPTPTKPSSVRVTLTTTRRVVVTRTPKPEGGPSPIVMRKFYPKLQFSGIPKSEPNSEPKKESEFEYVEAVERETLPPQKKVTNYEVLPIRSKILVVNDPDDEDDYSTKPV